MCDRINCAVCAQRSESNISSCQPRATTTTTKAWTSPKGCLATCAVCEDNRPCVDRPHQTRSPHGNQTHMNELPPATRVPGTNQFITAACYVCICVIWRRARERRYGEGLQWRRRYAGPHIRTRGAALYGCHLTSERYHFSCKYLFSQDLFIAYNDG